MSTRSLLAAVNPAIVWWSRHLLNKYNTYIAVLSMLLLSNTAFADTTFEINPITTRLDLVLNNEALGNVTGLTIRMSNLNCSTFASSGTLTTNSDGVFIC